MSDIHDQVHLFSDGELPEAEADAFRLHLGTCARCQQVLHDILQADHAMSRATPAAKTRRAQPMWRRRSVQTGLALVAAALLAVLVWPRPAVVQGPTGPRHLEARVSWPLGDAWRPYEALRGAVQSDSVPMTSLALLEKNGESESLASAWLLMGDAARAQKLLSGLSRNSDVLADLAATELAAQRPEEALALAQRALDDSPKHSRALWNAALAAQELGLIRVAADFFGQVASLREPGWSDEASLRQRALLTKAEQTDTRYQQFLDAAGRMVLEGTPLTDAEAAIAPSSARMYLSYALLAAPSRERVEALLPLARTLDRVLGGDALVQTVQRDAADDFAVRAPFALQFRGVAVDLFRALTITGFAPKIADSEQGLGDGRAKFISQLVAKKQLRFLPLSIPLTSQLGDHFADFEQAVQQQNDLWFTLSLANERARRAMAAGDVTGAEQQWLEVVRQASTAPLREMQAREQLLQVYLRAHRASEAQLQAWAVLRLARAQGERAVELRVLRFWADSARWRNLSALARAALAERSAGMPGRCDAKRELEESLAWMAIGALEPVAAREALLRAASCGDPLSEVGAFAWSDVLRLAPDPADATPFAEALKSLRAQAEGPSDRALLDQLEGRVLLDRDPVAGEVMIRSAVAQVAGQPASDALATKVRASAFGVLRTEAAARQQWERLFTLTREELGHPLADGCALVVEVQDDRIALAARSASGSFSGAFHRVLLGGHRHPDDLTIDEIAAVVRPVVLAANAGCTTLAVYAGFPLHGRAEWLPDEIAWSWAGGADKRTPVGTEWLVVSEVETPAALKLPRLSAWSTPDATGGQTLQGTAATPERVLSALPTAAFIEFDAHGLVNTGSEDTAMLVLAQGAAGYGLTASAVRQAKLPKHPVVLLGACRAATVAPFLHERWSLPRAFLDAGASAVIAAPVELPDAEAREFFARVVARLKKGEAPALALRDERVAWLAAGKAGWVRTVLVFD